MKFLFVFAAVFAVGFAELVGEYDTTIFPLEPEVQTEVPYKEVIVEVPVSSSKAPTFAPVYIPTFATRRPTTQAPTTARPTTRVVYTSSSARPQVYSRNLEVSSNDVNAKTVREVNEINPNGEFRYGFETSNGIANQAEGVIRNYPGNPGSSDIVINGAFAWKAPGGEPVDITYTADEEGYKPQGNAIPTPPPTPDAILRAVEWLKSVLSKRTPQQ